MTFLRKIGKIPCFVVLVLLVGVLFVVGCGSSLPENQEIDDGVAAPAEFVSKGVPPTNAAYFNFRTDVFRELLTDGSFAEQPLPLSERQFPIAIGDFVEDGYKFEHPILAGFDNHLYPYYLNSEFSTFGSLPRLALNGKDLVNVSSDWSGFGYTFSFDFGVTDPIQAPENLSKVMTKTLKFQPTQAPDMSGGKKGIFLGQLTNYYFLPASFSQGAFSVGLEVLKGGTHSLVFGIYDPRTNGTDVYYPDRGTYTLSDEKFDTVIDQPKPGQQGVSGDVKTLTGLAKVVQFVLDNDGHVVRGSTVDPAGVVWLQQSSVTSDKSEWCLPPSCSVTLRTNLPTPSGQIKDTVATCVAETGACSLPEFAKVPDGSYEVSALINGKTVRGGLRIRLGSGSPQKLTCVKTGQADGVFIFTLSLSGGQLNQCQNSEVETTLQ